MKKIINILLIISLMMTYFIPINLVSVEASSTYNVYFVNTSGVKTKIGSYSSYSTAKTKANSISGTSSNYVPVVYKDTSLIYVKYGIAKLKGSGTISIYKNSNLTTRLGYTHPDYGSDTLFIDYNETYNTVKIKIAGLVGYVKKSQVTLYPSSNSNALKTYYLRSDSSTYGPQLTHYYDGMATTIGPSPIYLKANKKYYSYDGNYFYTTIGNAVLDERYNSKSRAVNKYPYFNYYQYLPSRTKTTYTASNINSYIGYSAKIDRSKYYKTITSDNYDTSKNWIKVISNSELRVREQAGLSYKQVSNGWAYPNNIYEHLNKGSEKIVDGYKWYKIKYNSSITGYIASNPDEPWVSRYVPSPSSQLVWIGPNTSACDYYSTCFPSNQSMLYKEGTNFINSQTKYGINALQTLALSINESGWGRSFIAVKRNNVFGHGAYDSDPDGGAYVYSSVGASINYHAYGFMARDYNNPLVDNHYAGTHYGNKQSGNNVYYASDPYWGEKMAAYYYRYDRHYTKADYNNYKVGFKTGQSALKVYSDTDGVTAYYSLSSLKNIPVVILGTETGKTVNGSNKWYKIQSDVPIDSNRKIITGKTQSTYTYNYSTSYAYVPASYIYVENQNPVITASNKTIKKGTEFNPLTGVTAYDSWDGSLTSKIAIKSNNVNTNVDGNYYVTYSVKDSNYNTTTKKISVNVVTKVIANAPTISGASNITIVQGDELNLLSGVTANDFEDGVLTSKIKVTPTTIDTNTPGTYPVTYSITDSDNNVTKKTINVKVENSQTFQYTSKSGNFGFESLKWDSTTNLLNIKGYLTITGINNKIDTSIRYDLVLTNELTKTVYTKSLARWTKNSEWPYKVGGSTKYDYTYSWFNGNIDLSDIPQGNYDLTIRARSGIYESKSVFRNIFLKPMDTKITSSAGRGYQFRTNYFSNKVPLQLFIRDNGLLTTKKNPTVDNMVNSVYQINLSNNKLNIYSTSYNVKGNYNTSKNITRQIVLENVSTFDRISKEVGYLDRGAYKVTMAVPDGLSKTRAWYKGYMDLSTIPVGTYTIYIRTNAITVDDHGELYDIFNKNIANTVTIGDKTYSLKRNNEKRYRIELVVK